MNSTERKFKFSGRVAPQNESHQVSLASSAGAAPDEHYIAPTTINVTITNPASIGTIGVPQFSATVYGGTSGYSPAEDCGGNFMSYKFQANNNCYAYGTNIASNTFPQPGRASGNYLPSFPIEGPTVQQFAEADGLQYVGTSLADVKSFAQKKQATSPGGNLQTGSLGGHFVALMISPAGDNNWPGDYHWARCDDNINYSSWSQKDGGDQVTNFDFAGNPITDPATANWTVNQGPVQPNPNQPGYNPDDLVVDYAFFCYMFVPDSGVNIL